MQLLEAKTASDSELIPLSMHTIYKWHQDKRYPAFIIKVAGKIFVDLDEWDQMVVRARDAQVKEMNDIEGD